MENGAFVPKEQMLQIGPDLSSNCLQRLSADNKNNVIHQALKMQNSLNVSCCKFKPHFNSKVVSGGNMRFNHQSHVHF